MTRPALLRRPSLPPDCLFDQQAEITHHKSRASIRRHATLHPCNVMALCAQPNFTNQWMQSKNSRVEVCVKNLVWRHFTEHVKISNLPRRMEQFLSLWIYLTYPASMELCIFVKGRQNLERDWTDLRSVTFKQNQSDYLLTVLPGSSGL